MSEYLEDVQRYDSGANDETVAKIVKHLGIALRGRDSSLVSCTDTSELDRVREKWSMKKPLFVVGQLHLMAPSVSMLNFYTQMSKKIKTVSKRSLIQIAKVFSAGLFPAGKDLLAAGMLSTMPS